MSQTPLGTLFLTFLPHDPLKVKPRLLPICRQRLQMSLSLPTNRWKVTVLMFSLGMLTIWKEDNFETIVWTVMCSITTSCLPVALWFQHFLNCVRTQTFVCVCVCCVCMCCVCVCRWLSVTAPSSRARWARVTRSLARSVFGVNRVALSPKCAHVGLISVWRWTWQTEFFPFGSIA